MDTVRLEKSKGQCPVAFHTVNERKVSHLPIGGKTYAYFDIT